MTISLNEKQLKKLVNTAVMGILKGISFEKNSRGVNSPSARHKSKKTPQIHTSKKIKN